MKNKSVFIFAIALSTHMAFSDCDCTIVPFPRACVKQCMGKLAAKADYKELTKSFGVPASTSQKIVNFSDRDKVTSIDSYKKVLTQQELSTVKDKFSKADKQTVASILSGSQPANVNKKKASPIKE